MPKVSTNLGLAKLVCEVRVDPALAYFTEQPGIALQVESFFRNWSTDGLTYRFLDPASRSALSLEHNRLAFDMDIPADTPTYESRLRRVLKPYLKSSHIKSVTRVGVRGQYFVNKDFRFEELVAIYTERLFQSQPSGSSFMAGKMADLMFNVVVEKTERQTMHLVSGPVRREELSRWTKPISWNVGEAPEPLEYPEVAAFIDVDVYCNGKLTATEPDDIVSSALRLISTTARGFSEQLFGDVT